MRRIVQVLSMTDMVGESASPITLPSCWTWDAGALVKEVSRCEETFWAVTGRLAPQSKHFIVDQRAWIVRI